MQASAVFKRYDWGDQLSKLRLGKTVVSIDPRYFRPTEVETLLGDPSKAKKKLGWKQKISFKEMIKEMVEHDLNEGMRDAISKKSGFAVPESFEANM